MIYFYWESLGDELATLALDALWIAALVAVLLPTAGIVGVYVDAVWDSLYRISTLRRRLQRSAARFILSLSTMLTPCAEVLHHKTLTIPTTSTWRSQDSSTRRGSSSVRASGPAGTPPGSCQTARSSTCRAMTIAPTRSFARPAWTGSTVLPMCFAAHIRHVQPFRRCTQLDHQAQGNEEVLRDKRALLRMQTAEQLADSPGNST